MARRPRKRKPRKRRRIDPQELKKIMGETVSVKCAFCDGKGKDPFGLLSTLSDCQVCLGAGKVKVRKPVTKCAFCEGTGIQPYTTSRLHCSACGGKGSVTVIEPAMDCPTCGGTGVYPRRPHPMPCHTCKGQGVVPKRQLVIGEGNW